MNVLIDRNARTAIVVRRGYKLTHIVQLEEGELVLRAITQAELTNRGFRELNYPIKRAVRKYLRHSGGVSAKARLALRNLLKAEEVSNV